MEKENINNSDKKSPSENDMDEIIDELPRPDMSQVNTDLDIDKIRDRTFNKELSDLVTKIRSNESAEKDETQAEEPVIAEEKEDEGISEEDILLKMFHKLFYKSINLTGIETVNTAFNPFDLYKESSSDDLIDIIHSEMNSLSLPEYAILAYDMEKRCYTCYINHIKSLDENDIIIDTSEELYASIMNNNAFILDNQTIDRDLYIKKRFSSKKDSVSETDFLFISFYSLFKDFYGSMDMEEAEDFLLNILPILMISLNENIGDHEKRNIYNGIKARLTVYFFLLQKKKLLETKKSYSNNLHSVYNFLDYTFRKYNRYNDCICAIIKCRNYINIESLFILNYLYNKLKKRLSDAAVSRIEKDRIILFTRKSKRKILDEILDDFNKFYSNLFRIEIFADEEFNTNKTCLLKNIKDQLFK